MPKISPPKLNNFTKPLWIFSIISYLITFKDSDPSRMNDDIKNKVKLKQQNFAKPDNLRNEQQAIQLTGQ